MPPLLPGDRHSNRNPGTKKPTSSESELHNNNDNIQNEILIEVVETNVLTDDKHVNKHETGKLPIFINFLRFMF